MLDVGANIYEYARGMMHSKVLLVDDCWAMTGSANIDHLVVDDKVYIKSNDQIATGDNGTFDMKTQVLVLSGKKVVLSQNDNVLVGCKLTVQMKSGLAQVDPCAGQRVQMSITPPPKSGAAQP